MRAHRIDPELMRPVGHLEIYDDPGSFDDTGCEREPWARHAIRVDGLNANESHQRPGGGTQLRHATGPFAYRQILSRFYSCPTTR